MIPRDAWGLALANLRRHRLRVLFTTAGVVIAIATFVALLSFAAGSQKWMDEGFSELGLLSTMIVSPRAAEPMAGRLAPPPLDGAAVRRLARLPGVRTAFPFLDFEVSATLADTTVAARARALPPDALDTKMFQRVLGEGAFSAPDAREAIVTRKFARQIGVADADSLVGLPLIVSLRVASLDSGVLNVVGPSGRTLVSRLTGVQVDSLGSARYRRRFMRQELNEGLGRFVSGVLTRQMTVAETLTVRGLDADLPQYNLQLAPILIPEGVARRFNDAGLNLSGDPTALLPALRTGTLFAAAGVESSRTYPRVTLDLTPLADHTAVKDSVEMLGFTAFSFAEQFRDLQRFHLYFYAGLGVIGLLALITSALGILNTLMMSVAERRREIGVLKSLGADERFIRGLFLVESGLIGAAGAALGIVLGWLGTRLVSIVIKAIMAREQMPVVEPFALPAWLVLAALGFGIAVSVLAGTYPAARAARVDPVEALRGD